MPTKAVPKAFTIVLIFVIITFSGCERNIFKSETAASRALRDVSAVRLNFRYEPDVPGPSDAAATAKGDERNAAAQSDFDANRPQEILDRTLISPDKKRVLAIYHRVTDLPDEYRLDMYSPDGKLLKKLTSDTMAVHFPDTIVWAPDSGMVAFVAMIRAGGGETTTPPQGVSNSNSDVSNPEGSTPTPPPALTPAPPTGILTFRTEQIYTCNADGSVVKALTQNEGLIYFYYVWSPDSSMLAALAATAREWQYLNVVADHKGEIMTPQGRLRIIEKNGRERRLDDNLTPVRPVWSPDSAKVAVAFDTQVRIYDANGTNLTQAAIPLRNQLLISSQSYERDQQRKLDAANANADTNTPANVPVDQPLSTLPDEKSLVSYNPIVTIAWPDEDLLYLMTAFVKRTKNEADSAVSFSRWHRLIFTAQAVAPAK